MAELQTKMQSHKIRQGWGGDELGMCVQISACELSVRDSIIKLTMEEAAALCNDLGKFVKTEATRRQALLRDELARCKLEARAVFHEVAELPADLMAGPELAVMMVSKFCPKAPRDA